MILIKNKPVSTMFDLYDHFPSINRTILDNMEISLYVCPDSNEFTFLGNIYNPSYSSVIFIADECIGTTSTGAACKTSNQIKDAVTGASFDAPIMNGYFDGKDFNTQIKEYLDDRLYDYPIYDQRKYVFTNINSLIGNLLRL